jgi:hypothetical protein
MRSGVFWLISVCCAWTYRGMRDGENASRLGCALDLSKSNVPECRRRAKFRNPDSVRQKDISLEVHQLRKSVNRSCG